MACDIFEVLQGLQDIVPRLVEHFTGQPLTIRPDFKTTVSEHDVLTIEVQRPVVMTLNGCWEDDRMTFFCSEYFGPSVLANAAKASRDAREISQFHQEYMAQFAPVEGRVFPAVGTPVDPPPLRQQDLQEAAARQRLQRSMYDAVEARHKRLPLVKPPAKPPEKPSPDQVDDDGRFLRSLDL